MASRVIRASYDDECAFCLGDIWQGDDIRMTDEGPVHDDYCYEEWCEDQEEWQ